MATGEPRNKRLMWIAKALACIVIGFFVLVSIQEKNGVDLGLPKLDFPGAEYIRELLGDFSPEADSSTKNIVAVNADAGVKVHFIDVGQGEAILIAAPEKNVLIDTGEKEQSAKLLKYINACGMETIDIAIGTHPHSDHIGGLRTVIESMPVESVVFPVLPDDMVPTTATYTGLLKAVAKAGIKITPAKPGISFDLGDGAVLSVLGPLEGYKYQDLNNYSVVARLDYGKTSFLFTGDQSADAENDLIKSGAGLDAGVLSVGHHGSNSATTVNFLNAVNPGVAVISCGIDNKYGHPHREVMSRLMEREIRINRTDLEGSVIISSDGEGFGIQMEKGDNQSGN